MPDITMCTGKDCPKKERCYRFKATPNLIYQSFSDFKERRLEDGSCEMFWEFVVATDAKGLKKAEKNLRRKPIDNGNDGNDAA